MADLEPALIGFIGALVGSATSLLGAYLTHRATAKRTDKEFIRSQLATRLERQQEARTNFRDAVASMGRGDPFDNVAQQALHSKLRIAFGDFYASEMASLFSKYRTGPDVEIEASVRIMVFLGAMHAMIGETQKALGIPPLESERIFKEAELKYLTDWAEEPPSPKPSGVTSKDKDSESGNQSTNG